MTTVIHFINVGQGNMALVECTNGAKFVVDCNITADNEKRVLAYLEGAIGKRSKLNAFICTHRDADHMRGVRTLHNSFPVDDIWDSGYPGTTTDSSEYEAYMRLRREVGERVIEKQTRNDFGRTRFRYLSAKDDRLPKEANEQGIILKVEQRSADKSKIEGSTILTGDGGALTWKDGITKDYSNSDISCSILLAGHHGSITFFDGPNDDKNYYTSHIKAIKPAMVVVSVGPNNYGHPDGTALRLYREHSTGANDGSKTHRTDTQGTAKLTLKSGGGWTLDQNK